MASSSVWTICCTNVVLSFNTPSEFRSIVEGYTLSERDCRFAIVVCPVYEDPNDRESSPFTLQNVDPFTWSWLSTINRVNSQVQKVRLFDQCLAR